jgi:hypothetical protein
MSLLLTPDGSRGCGGVAHHPLDVILDSLAVSLGDIVDAVRGEGG